MRETDKVHKERLSQTNWVFLKDVAPIDFWVGSQYLGNYAQRLQIDLAGLENICRFADLPPITLHSEAWNPPAAHTPETIAPGLSALKKVSFHKDPQLPETDKEYFRLSAMERRMQFRDNNIPVGWTIHIKDRKLLYDYAYSHPSASIRETEKQFIKDIDNTLRTSLMEVAFRESFAFRLFGAPTQYTEVGSLVFRHLMAATYSGIVSPDGPNLLKFISMSMNSAFVQAFYKSTDIGVAFLFKNRAKKDEVKVNHFPSGDHRRATYIWRRIKFPDRSWHEYEHEDMLKRFSASFLPGGLLFEDVYLTWLALAKHQSPFLRLADS